MARSVVDNPVSGPDRQQTDNAYRAEVDGLRAIAVLATMLFHAQIPYFGGGFLGVDIFFAISGFLITGIIVRNAERGQFSLSGFYMRRIRRIIPALSVMCLLVLPFAWLLMMPDDLQNYGQSMVATALSANNVLLYMTSGYFEMEASFKPLLHTWSLGVEEQYYVIAPLLLMLSLRLGGRRGAIALLAITTLLSLILAEAIRWNHGVVNYLLLPSRFWELSIGGLTALLQPGLLRWFASRNRLRQWLTAAGLAMTIFSLFWLTEDMNLPGWQSLVPVGGTCIVLALADGSGVGRFLSLKPMVGIGLISYSAYLYHKPLDALLRIASLELPSRLMLWATIPAALFLAWLSWKFVETPFRDARRTTTRMVLQFSAATTALLIGLGMLLHATMGFYSSWPELADRDPLFSARNTMVYTDAPFAYEDRPFPTRDRARNMLVIGDSFARDFINMGLETRRLANLDVSLETQFICPAKAHKFVERLRNAGSVVIALGLPENPLVCTKQIIALAEAHQVPHTIVIGTKNFGYNNNAIMLLPEAERYRYRAKPDAETLARAQAVGRELPARHYIDVLALLDDGSGTVPVFTPERKFISQDRAHLTKPGAKFVGEKVFAQPQFAWLAKPAD